MIKALKSPTMLIALLLSMSVTVRADSLGSLVAEYVDLMSLENALVEEIIELGDQLDNLLLSCAELDVAIAKLVVLLAFEDLTAAEETSIRAQMAALSWALSAEEEDVDKVKKAIKSKDDRLTGIRQRINEIEYILAN